jgi:pimeloyl-ACP methyl ester carboxylesterase
MDNVDQSGPVVPPLWRELRAAVEAPALLRSRAFRAPPRAADPGLPVLLIPGVYCPDSTLTPMARWLGRMGYAPKRAGIGFNADCSEAEMGRLEVRLERAARHSGGRTAIVGWSRGGLFARALAVRRPDLVAGIVTLGSPLQSPLRYVHPFLHLALEATSSLGDRGLPHLLTHKCADEWAFEGASNLTPLSRVLVGRARRLLDDGDGPRCCEPFWRDLRGAFPVDVEFVSLYSRSDGIVHWRGCLDPAARHVEVDASHCGMGMSARVYPVLADQLARIAAAERAPSSDEEPLAA